MWQIQSIPTTKIWVGGNPPPEPESFVDVVNDSDNIVASVSLEYIDGPTQSDELSAMAGTFGVAFEDSNVYQSGNESLDSRSQSFTAYVENMVVSAANQSEPIDVEIDGFTALETDVYFFATTQEEYFDVTAGTFTAQVTP